MVMERNVNIKARIYGVLAILLLCFVGLGFRLYWIQVVRHEELTDKAKKKYITAVVTHGMRGAIYDTKGTLIAGDKPFYLLKADPLNFPLENKDCPHVGQFQDPRSCAVCPRSERAKELAARFLAHHLGLDYHQLKRDFSQTQREVIRDGVKSYEPNRYVLVAKKIDYNDGTHLKEKMREHVKQCQDNIADKAAKEKIDYSRAFSLQTHYGRSYTRGRMLSNILGFVNTEYEKTTGVSGLEKSMNTILTAKDGRQGYEKDPRGGALGIDGGYYELEAPVNGADIHLTVDEAIQTILERELDVVVEKHRPKLVYGIVADPRTGRILALAQRPTFDPNDRATFINDNMQNKMSENIFEPGSTMKPIPIAFAIDRGIVRPGDTIFCENGMWYYAGKPLRDTNKYGLIDIKKIIQVSSNIGTAKVGLKFGNQLLDECFRSYGFGSRTELPLKPESRGIYPRLKGWSMLTPTRIVIGQGIAVTPFQMVRAYSALANNGLLPTLKLVDHYVRYDELGNGTVEYPNFAPPTQIFLHPEATSATIRGMMKAVCEPGGTAKRGGIPGYFTAGKTGTAQKVINGQYSNSKYVGSFVGFAPVDDPKFVMLIAVDEPTTGGYYGGVVAAPAFASAGEKILRYMNVKPDYEIGGPMDPDESRRKLAARNTRPNEDPSAIRNLAISNPFPTDLRDPDEGGFGEQPGLPEGGFGVENIFDPSQLEDLRQTQRAINTITQNPNSDLAPPIRFR